MLNPPSFRGFLQFPNGLTYPTIGRISPHCLGMRLVPIISLCCSLHSFEYGYGGLGALGRWKPNDLDHVQWKHKPMERTLFTPKRSKKIHAICGYIGTIFYHHHMKEYFDNNDITNSTKNNNNNNNNTNSNSNKCIYIYMYILYRQWHIHIDLHIGVIYIYIRLHTHI